MIGSDGTGIASVHCLPLAGSLSAQYKLHTDRPSHHPELAHLDVRSLSKLFITPGVFAETEPSG
jgi:hypothetical protein